MLLRQVHLYDAIDTIMHYLRNNDLGDTAQVIQLFYTYDTMCPINISPENDDNDDDPLDATLSWDDIVGLQAEQATGYQDIDPQDLPSTSASSASQDMFQDF